jgi:predicted TIM-barrel fold metal-dependent hydrolase
MILSVFGSDRRNNQFVLDALKTNFPKDIPATCPLAMDIRYLFAPVLQYDMMSGVEEQPLYLNSGLKKQLKVLKVLSARGNCYPFFPVDPRRPGIVKAILSGTIVTKEPGGFYGIKLYPRLGYHPLSSNLSLLYAYCEINDIPITTHASPNGFPPYGTSSGEFANPINYESILEKRPNLRINFAHWGRGESLWAATILRLMKTYPHVYADLACYNSPLDVVGFLRNYWTTDIVRQRTMYGSDFDVFYLTNTKFDMDSYIRTFITMMSENDLDGLMCRNPEAFLGIGGEHASKDD